MTIRLTSRLGYLLGFLICTGLIGFALYLQYVEHQEPCPLCMLQRLAYYGLMLVFLIGAVHSPGRIGTAIYGALLLLIAGAGAAVAARQVWLQSLPKNLVPECGPGLDYILERFPLHRALDMILRGSGECAEKGWTFLGLTIAGWSLLWLVLLGLFGVFLAWRAHSERGATAS
ncbi:MAG TPA: disulfide bond formation protein B [Burkholderiales bacterium]|nr:disulfide bond formation protein B [Burkholderiales bacterium]